METVQNQGLRLCLGAFRTSPMQSLYVEAREPSFYDRITKLSLHYMLKVKANTCNPTHQSLFELPFTDRYASKPKAIKPLGLRMQPHIENMNIDLGLIAQIGRAHV